MDDEKEERRRRKEERKEIREKRNERRRSRAYQVNAEGAGQLQTLDYAAVALLFLDVIFLVGGIALFAMTSSCSGGGAANGAGAADSGGSGESDYGVQTSYRASEILRLTKDDTITSEFDCGTSKISPDTGADGLATPHSWPWVVSIVELGDGAGRKHICAGTILSSRHVLTAAHCFASDVDALKKYGVLLGIGDIAKTANDSLIGVSTVRLHPKTDVDVNSDEPMYDFALLSVIEEMEFGDNVQPICLSQPDKSPPDGMSCWSQEWATSSGDESNETSQVLQQSETTFLSEDGCVEKSKAENKKENAFCATKGSEFCSSDSGGPVACEESGKWTMYGVKSYGPEDCEGDLPFVYASVPFHVPWLCCYMESLAACSNVHCKLSGDPEEKAAYVAKVYPDDEFVNKNHKRGMPEIEPNLKQTRIAGGAEAVAHSWPWVVSLTEYTPDGFLEHFCGGTLISPRHVISSASCFQTDRGFEESRLHVFVRIHEPQAGTLHRVSLLRKNPKFEGEDALTYDLVLLTLEPEVRIDADVLPAALPGLNVELDLGTTCWTQGWGDSETGQSTTLNQAMVTINSSDSCQNVTGSSTIGDSICAAQDKKLCQTDSGGPLTCYEDEKWILYGVVSWKEECATEDVEIYASVSAAMGWICCFVPDIPECEEQDCVPELPPATPETDDISKIIPKEVPNEEGLPQGSTKLYPEDVFYPYFICGETVNKPDLQGGRIIGGVEAVPHSWPWVAALHTQTESWELDQFCVATLISMRHLVSSASCFTEDRGFSQGMLYAQLGHHGPESHGYIFKVVRMRLHPKFDPSTPQANDIALMTIDPEIPFTDVTIWPICLPKPYAEVSVGKECWTQGWGTVNRDEAAFSETLQQVMVAVGSVETCAEQRQIEVKKEWTVCAGEAEDRGSCIRDSGAPLGCEEDGSFGKEWVLYGSTGTGLSLSCGHGTMSAYSSIAFAVDWICCFMAKTNRCKGVVCIYDETGKQVLEPGSTPPADSVDSVDSADSAAEEDWPPHTVQLYEEDLYSPTHFSCGVSVLNTRPRIIGGEEAIAHSWPWVVSLSSYSEQFCAGVILNPRHILSAASCFNVDRGVADGKVFAFVGHHGEGSAGAYVKVKWLRLHPRFSKDVLHMYNIALLTLELEIAFSNKVSSVCMPPPDTPLEEGKRCWTQGWGSTDPNAMVPSDKLQEVAVTVSSVDTCTTAYGLTFDSKHNICAGNETIGPCVHDNGAPLTCTTDVGWVLYGVTGHMASCASVPVNEFTAVSYVMKWFCCIASQVEGCEGICMYDVLEPSSAAAKK